MSFSKNGLYFQWGGEPQTVSYTTIDAISLELKTSTEGWTVTLDTAANTITITPPQDPGTEEKRDKMRDGEFKFVVASEEGVTSYYTLYAYIVGDSLIMLGANGQYANSYILTTPKTAYALDLTKDGKGQTISGVAGELPTQSP